MASLCKVCQHDACVQIDAELRQGATVTSVAEKYGLSKSGVSRHQARHLVRTTAGGRVTAELRAMSGASQTEQLDILLLTAISTLERAAKSGSGTVANQAIREIRGIISERAKAKAEDKYGGLTVREAISFSVSTMSEDQLHRAVARTEPEVQHHSRTLIETMRDLFTNWLEDPRCWSADGRLKNLRAVNLNTFD